MKKTSLAALLVALLLAPLPLAAYTVYLKDGAKLIAQAPPEFRGGLAIITLQNGTQSSLAAEEIDVERTREANQRDIGSALILEGGEFTEQPKTAEPQREERLSDIVRQNNDRSQNRSRTAGKGRAAASDVSKSADLFDFRRSPYRNLDVAGEIQGVFRGQGVEQTRLYQGTASNRVLIDLTTDSVAAVFRALKVAATALVHVETAFPGTIEAFELVLTTSNRARAGEFLLGSENATLLAQGKIEASTFFVDHVRF